MLKFAKSVCSKKSENNTCIYIDSGNSLYSGQILTQVFNYPDENQNLSFEKKKFNFKKMFPINNEQDDTQQVAHFWRSISSN